MSRLQQKCLVASAGTHVLLLSLLFISPAFIPAKQEPELPVVYLIPDKLTDDPSSGGGSPTAVAPVAPPQQTPPPAPVTPPPQKPQAEVIPPREPEPTPPEPKPAKKTEPERTKPIQKPNESQAPATKPVEKPPKPKREIKPTFEKSKDSARAQAEAKGRAKAEAEAKAAQAQLLAKLSQVGRSLSKNLSPGTTIEIPGPGGAAFMNYSQFVKTAYQNAWLPPSDVADDSAIVKTRVIIQRDGNVKSAVIIERSGIPALDRSVGRALNLDFIAPFPDGAKDLERTFDIDFNLKSKR
jgi:TonB family protein